METCGITQDGKTVVKGIGQLYFQEGLPLGIIFDKLQKSNMIPSWKDLYKEMRENGMSHKRVIDLLRDQMLDAYGKEFRDVVIGRIVELKNGMT